MWVPAAREALGPVLAKRSKSGREVRRARRPAAVAPAVSCFRVRIQPGASSDRLAGKEGDEAWKITLRARAIEGRANTACLRFLGKLLGRPPSALRIVRGERSRHKVIEVAGLTRDQVEALLTAARGC